MRNLILSALLLASALQTAVGQTYTSGDYNYTLSNNQATVTRYIGEGGAVSIPNTLNSYNVVSIGSNAFLFFNGLTSIIIPNSVTSIGGDAFAYCSSLTSITIPNSITSIGERAFAGCESLTTLTIPNSVTSIGADVFNDCSGLTTLIIGSGVTSMGRGAFFGCTGLTSIVIGGGITSIGSYEFRDWRNLRIAFLPVQFEATYSNLGLTESQVFIYHPTSRYLEGQQSVISNPSAHDLYTAVQYNANFNTGRDSVINNPSAQNLYTSTQYTANFNAGKDSVLNSPNSNGLYTTSQIQNMAVGDLVLTKNVAGSFTLNYDIEQSTDLQTWTPYQALSLPLTGLPTDKAFVRIKAKQ